VSDDYPFWFADVSLDDEDSAVRGMWQPCLQAMPGICHSFEIWFNTESECLEYISEYIIGAPLEGDADSPPEPPARAVPKPGQPLKSRQQPIVGLPRASQQQHQPHPTQEDQ
jgi:hypothetical protein